MLSWKRVVGMLPEMNRGCSVWIHTSSTLRVVYARLPFGVVVDRGVLVNGQRGLIQGNGVPARLVLLCRGLDNVAQEEQRTKGCTHD